MWHSLVVDPVSTDLVPESCGMMVLGLAVSILYMETSEDVHEAGYDLVFLSIFLLGDAFFFPLLPMMGSVISAPICDA